MKAYRYIRASGIQIIQTDPNEATVEWFYVDPDDRGRGIGLRLMNATCKDADREGVSLILEPVPFGVYNNEEEEFYPPSLTHEELCNFYRSFGFRFMKNSELMKRNPKTP